MNDLSTTGPPERLGLRCLLLPLAGCALLLAGCSIDFNEAVPCYEDSNCPASMFCNTAIGRCQSGERPTPDAQDDTAADVAEEVAEDPVPQEPDLVQDPPPGEPDLVQDPPPGEPDLVQDPVTDTADTPDVTDADACVPTTEVCNGLDDDCDGTPDDDIDCGTCPDAANMGLVSREGIGSFCVDLYEASRPDADGFQAGTDESQASSRPGVLPWASAPLETARAACVSAGKRLCTTEEWTEACGGPFAWLYPYDAIAYDEVVCNGDSAATQAARTRSRPGCESPEGLFDMSGNVEEWVEEGSTRGGSFTDGDTVLRCTGLGESPDPATPNAEVGFRCCADTVE